MLAGSIVFSGNAISPLGNSEPTSSPEITITGKKVKTAKGAAVTDSQGYATVKLGQASVRLHFTDGTTATPLDGLSVAAVVDKRNKSRAAVAAVDGLGRYPLRILLLHGPSQVTSALTAGVMGGTDPPTPLEVIQWGWCAGIDADTAARWELYGPVETSALPPLSLPPSPPPPAPAIPDDPSAPLIEAIRLAMGSAMAQKEQAVISTENVTCPQALQHDLDAVSALPGEFLLGFPAKLPLLDAFPNLRGAVLVGGTATTLLPVLNGARDVLYCGLPPADGLMIKQVNFLPALPELHLFWHQPAVEPESDPFPLFPVAATATDPLGQPLTTGSLELLSKANLGVGYMQVLDSQGNESIPVPLGDYNWRVRAPGYQPACGETSVTESGAAINANLQSNPIASGRFLPGQPTGFLKPGTQFKLTPEFKDAAGNVVECSGQVVYQVKNPVGSVVAMVDQSGNVTMGNACGAARITAWCSGIKTNALVSTDCNGTLPAVPIFTFAVSPTSLSFTATEGGPNPPSQILTIVPLSPHFMNPGVNWREAWLSVSDPNPPGVRSISVDISGLAPGTYTTTIDVTDLDAPVNHQSVPVTLKILPSRNRGGEDISGTWVGTWTLPTNYTFSPFVCNNLQNKAESGTIRITLSSQSGGVPSLYNLTGTVNSMSGLQAASIPCGGGDICNNCSWNSFSPPSTAIDPLSMWANVTNQVLIFVNFNLPPMAPPLYINYDQFESMSFSGTYANSKITGTLNGTGTFSLSRQ
jgi:hypothetical protein